MPYFQPNLTLPSSLSFHNKTILITGASAGLGLAATKALLHHGAKEVIAAVRNISKAKEATSKFLSDPELKKTNPQAKITILHLDLEDYASVLSLAQEVKKRYDGKLDMLLLNAGTGSLKWERAAKSGHEKTIQVNLLSPALLAVELLPALDKTATITGVPSRITWVGSFVQFDHTLEKKPIEDVGNVLGHFDDESKFVSMGRYSDSKLLGTIFVEQLAGYVDPGKVVVNDVSPGMVRTGFGEYPLWLRGMFTVFFGLKARSVEEGAKTYLYALAVAGKESHGKYLSDNLITERAQIISTSVGKELRKGLWNDMWKDFLRQDGKLEPLKPRVW
ncbi:NAD(P)-binding protein [Mollisia scopiformis]|uniref:NAD(P)-binding protein n=1 Tax=Mollisia scopiformis TaxID=149040 RepID=A0A132BCL0_MOLSC|nr:NAD(P)-binding protein [Mollisia scopiformis]KUJ10111.1 NAD(P)-binding protein [Mollisia scopiformis]